VYLRSECASPTPPTRQPSANPSRVLPFPPFSDQTTDRRTTPPLRLPQPSAPISPVQEKKGSSAATVTIKYADARRGQVVLNVNADEVEEMARRYKAGPPRPARSINHRARTAGASSAATRMRAAIPFPPCLIAPRAQRPRSAWPLPPRARHPVLPRAQPARTLRGKLSSSPPLSAGKRIAEVLFLHGEKETRTVEKRSDLALGLHQTARRDPPRDETGAVRARTDRHSRSAIRRTTDRPRGSGRGGARLPPSGGQGRRPPKRRSSLSE
jgi:hypothetical protein